ncbi:MAG TPA: HlyD family efflux transporter periplasmic adaptor subunit, partial [Candidatus Hydrogenedentes bacterium]|nr:HlyD family efflux transporter periplasmic adaptor subunit [Candidatus Hydrogenedentota bacterium]
PKGEQPADAPGRGTMPRGGRTERGRPQHTEGTAGVNATAPAGGEEETTHGAEALAKEADEAERAAQEAERLAEKAVEAFRQAVEAAGGECTMPSGDVSAFGVHFEDIDFRNLAGDERLGGEAEQKRRTLESDIMLENQQLIAAKEKLEGTRKLFEHDFVTEAELRRDEMTVTLHEIGLESKQTSEDLFFRYEFPKQAEVCFSDYEEALRNLDRVLKEASTKLMSAKVGRDSAEARFKVEEKARSESLDQLEKTKIYAEHEGLVVYGDGSSHRWQRGDPIAEGTTVRQNQTILTIPDITQMAVKVPIHESAIKKVALGQKAGITIEAFPKERLVGEVTKVSVLPSSEDRWLNPDLKVYETTISIEGVHEWLKPGMTAEVEIAIAELEDVLFVPLQAVSSHGEDRVVYLADKERRVVETGQFNDKYIAITSGLEEGDEVLLWAVEGEAGGEEKTSEAERETEGGADGTVPAQGE